MLILPGFSIGRDSVAFVNGVIVRQIINSIILLILGIIIGVMYGQTIRHGTVTFAVFLLHIAATSGFVTNGGIQGYAVVLMVHCCLWFPYCFWSKGRLDSVLPMLCCSASFHFWLGRIIFIPQPDARKQPARIGFVVYPLATGTVLVQFSKPDPRYRRGGQAIAGSGSSTGERNAEFCDASSAGQGR